MYSSLIYFRSCELEKNEGGIDGERNREGGRSEEQMEEERRDRVSVKASGWERDGSG